MELVLKKVQFKTKSRWIQKSLKKWSQNCPWCIYENWLLLQKIHPQSWRVLRESIDGYDQIERYMNLSSHGKPQDVHIHFYGNALRCIHDAVKYHAVDYQQAIELVHGKRKLTVRWTKIKNHAKRFRVRAIVNSYTKTSFFTGTGFLDCSWIIKGEKNELP